MCDEPVPPAPDRRVAEHGEDAFHRQQCLLLAKEPQLGTTRTSEAAVIVVVHASGEMGGEGGGGAGRCFWVHLLDILRANGTLLNNVR